MVELYTWTLNIVVVTFRNIGPLLEVQILNASISLICTQRAGVVQKLFVLS